VTKDPRTLFETIVFRHGIRTYGKPRQTATTAMPVGKKIEKCVVDSKPKRQRPPFLLTDNCLGSTNRPTRMQPDQNVLNQCFAPLNIPIFYETKHFETISSHSFDREARDQGDLFPSNRAASSANACNSFHLVDPLAISTVSTISASGARRLTNSPIQMPLFFTAPCRC
jgi:hypothetical protein